jgi:hypothetical protein
MAYFTTRKLIGGDLLVLGLLRRVPWVSELDHWRGDVEAAPPLVDCFFAMLFDGFNFAEALECTVVSFVKFPRLNYGDVVEVEFLSSVVEGSDCSVKHRSEAYVEAETRLSQHSPSS